ncbi:MAG: hypothetical protein Q8K78_14050 [Planctomycetaceae bacterium]|nr:hypothetical protein [Planctomycetaceae bacterium]
MPLPMKTLREVAAELGMPDAEVKAMVDMRKIRAVWKNSKLMIAPDEIAKLRRLRKTLPESEQRAATPEPAKPAPTKKVVPRQPAVKLPPPPPQ